MTTVTQSLTASPVISTQGSPVSDQDGPQILALQGGYGAPIGGPFSVETNPIGPPIMTTQRLQNFPSDIYSISESSLLVKIMKVLIGAAGAGQTRSKLLLTRLSTVLEGSHFYDLDNFYGALFGINRSQQELLVDASGAPLNPSTSLLTFDEWSNARAADASYRSRIKQFATGLSLGPSALGIKLVCDAILQISCDVVEGWAVSDFGGVSYTAMGSSPYTPWTTLQNFTYNNLMTASSSSPIDRNSIVIIPHRPISSAESFALKAALNLMKPASCSITINLHGYPLYQTIPIAQVAADSAYWHLKQSVIPAPGTDLYYNLGPVDSDGFSEVLRPPYSEYQGENICYNGDVVAVAAYRYDANGVVSSTTDSEVVVFADGSIKTYSPDLALSNPVDSFAARLVSEGIVQAGLYEPTAYSNGVAATSSIYVDGMSLDNLSSAISNSGISYDAAKDQERYWSTPSRPASDPTPDVIEIRFSGVRTINSLSMQLATYPQLVSLEYFDGSNWNVLSTTQIAESVPAVQDVLPPVSVNPQHEGAGHWQVWSPLFSTVSTDRVRLVLSRTTIGSPPYDPRTQGAGAYSLGVKGLTVNYLIMKRTDLVDSPIYTRDLLGSETRWDVREEIASNVLGSGIWRSAPQPSKNNIVNFFLDMRGTDGNSQLFDTIYMDPIYGGCSVAIYTSDDNPGGRGSLPCMETFAPTATGTVVPTSTGLQIAPGASLSLDNTKLQLDTSQPWWGGMQFVPNFSANDAVPHTIFSGAGISISVQSGSMTMWANDAGGPDSITVPVYFNAGDQVVVTFGMLTVDLPAEIDSRLFLGCNGVNSVGTQNATIKSIPFMSSFKIGGEPAGLTVSNFILKQTNTEEVWDGAAWRSSNDLFYSDASAYTIGGRYGVAMDSDNQYDLDAIVRFNPFHISLSNTYGFVGGPLDAWSSMSWNPILYGYKAEKGNLKIGPTKNKFIKLEFSNLSAQRINLFVPIQQTTTRYPAQKTMTSSAGVPGNVPTGAALNQSQAQTLFVGGTPLNPITPNPSPPSTSAIVPTTAQVGGHGWLWRFQSWQQPATSPNFIFDTNPNYVIQDEFLVSELAFFAGLNTLIPYRSNTFVENSSDFYDELFYDGVNIQSGGGWTLA